MAFHNKIGRFAGGFADFLTGNRYDFDGLGKPEKFENFLEKDDDDKEKEKGMLDNFLAGLQTYDPEKNKTETDKFLDMMSNRGFVSGGRGSFAQVGENLSLFNPDNSARENAILQQNQLNAARAAQAKENKSNVGRMAGAAIGNAIVPGVGGVVGGLLGGLFCDIRLKEDIAPLQKSEVNDVLSECAFFVKDLNELS
jgi:hypothetical protein